MACWEQELSGRSLDEMIPSARGDAASELELDGSKHHELDIAPLSDPETLSPGLMQLAFHLRDAPHSEHDPFLDAGIAMHPFTGAFVDPSHQSAFAAQLFRGALPFHILLMILVFSIVMFMELHVLPALRPLWGTIALSCIFFLISRVLLHFMQDAVRAQRLGSWTWTIAFAMCIIADSSAIVVDQDSTCAPTQQQYLVRQLNPGPSPKLNLNPFLPCPNPNPNHTVTVTLAVTPPPPPPPPPPSSSP